MAWHWHTKSYMILSGEEQSPACSEHTSERSIPSQQRYLHIASEQVTHRQTAQAVVESVPYYILVSKEVFSCIYTGGKYL